ncbi:hypothetical protein EC973_003565 [Apophysomyces ossiformis]|uniref:G-patch domain-containing protein n=1 Tax=Apophysomyces ossiformis TaxID=679940 RepID=A0A8H7BMC3_9FUNG|nr:hypothetical protein EC973_003565 [Apophysomyces ossiformis]
MSSLRKQEEVYDANELEYGDLTFDAELEEAQQASMETHIPESNVGYRLLQKMGWKAGQGLGSEGQGRIDPIRIDLKLDSLGVGKEGEENAYHVSSTAKRKALDSEKQLEETEEEKQQREVKAVKQEAIERELKVVKRAFYCELCDKQYRNISEYEQHLQSYDHHHRKRFKDMKEQARKSAFVQSDREKKRERERKREERELKRMQEAMRKSTSLVSDKKEPILTPVKNIERTAAVQNNSDSRRDGTGGWTTVTETSRRAAAAGGGGGWTTVAEPSGTRGGGWTTVPAPQATVATVASSVVSNTTVKQPGVAPADKDPSSSTVPAAGSTSVKLSFGMPQKKQGGFQFGLKKK